MLRFAITGGSLGARDNPESERQKRLIASCAALAAQGIDYILIREKDLAASPLTQLSRAVIAAIRKTASPTRVLIARRPDLAKAIGADGVHLSAAPGELTPNDVRRLIPNAFVSVSCHTLEEVRRARDNGASAILFGPIFGKVVAGFEVAPGIGLDSLRQACTLAGDIPVFALGGITTQNSAACIASGASGIAAIRMFFPVA
jgi:thiamine-phosphate pyrophosphorylase